MRRGEELILGGIVRHPMLLMTLLTVTGAMARDTKGRVIASLDEVARQVVRGVDELPVRTSMVFHVRGELITLIGMTLHAVILGVTLDTDTCLGPGVLLMIAKEVTFMAETRHGFQSDRVEILVAVHALQVLVLLFMVMTVQAHLHHGDVTVRHAGTAAVGGVTILTPFLHAGQADVLLVRKMKRGTYRRDLRFGNNVALAALIVVEPLLMAFQAGFHGRCMLTGIISGFLDRTVAVVAVHPHLRAEVKAVTVMMGLIGGRAGRQPPGLHQHRTASQQDDGADQHQGERLKKVPAQVAMKSFYHGHAHS